MLRLNVGLLAFMALFIRVSSFAGMIICHNQVILYADGIRVDMLGDSAPYQVNIPDNTKVLGVSCYNYNGPGGILASFDNGVVTDSSWRCIPGYGTVGWHTDTFDDSQWTSPLELEVAGDVQGVSYSAKWIWGAVDINRMSCRKTLSEETEGCSYKGSVHPAGDTWIQEVSMDPQRQRKCTCPDPPPANWSGCRGGCIAACVKEDGMVHYGGEQYQRTVDGVSMDCHCNGNGIERCA